MAITRVKTTLTGLASVAAGGNDESAVTNLHATTFNAKLRLKADNDGTPAANDTMTFKIKYDTSTFDAETTAHAEELVTLDTNAEDPAVKDIRIDPNSDTFVVRTVNNSSGRAITPSVELVEQRQSS